MILSLSGQNPGQLNNQFSEETLDGVYIGMRQANHYALKVEEQKELLRMYDSLTSGMAFRLNEAILREDNYIMIIDTMRTAWDIDKAVGKNEVIIATKKGKKWLKILVPSAFVGGMLLGVATSN